MCSFKFHQISLSLFATLILALFSNKSLGQREELSSDFEPIITAKCERSLMIINVVTNEPFYGVIHTRDYRRRNSCLVYGSGSFNTTLRISAVASEDDGKYCGVHKHKNSEEDRSVAIAVRLHRELELSQDKYYSITCSQSFFVNAKNSRSRLSMKFFGDQGQETSRRLIHGSSYIFKIEIDNPDNVYDMFVRNCIGFSSVNATEVELIDENGCPVDDTIIEPFDYSNATNDLSTRIKSMFKFPDSNRVYIQCNALLCRDGCDFKPDCTDSLYKKAFSSAPIRPDSNTLSLLTSTTVFVVDPGENSLDYFKYSEECTVWKFPWLVTLLIALASLLAIMLCLNIFLCTSLTCTCTKTEVIEKEDASELEDYDPYKIDWSANNTKMPIQASTFGSRTSLARHAITDGNESDFRPNSRYSSSQTGKKTPSYSYANYR